MLIEGSSKACSQRGFSDHPPELSERGQTREGTDAFTYLEKISEGASWRPTVSIPRIPEPARLIVSVLTPDRKFADSAATLLEQKLGPIEEEIGPLAFDFTSYYDAEMGMGIKRWIWVFADLTDRSQLVRIKRLTDEVESAYSREGKRRFNLDPGLLTLENFVLATGKNQAHRIYLGEGVFGDLTLIYRKGAYQPLPWTYPDYASRELIDVLEGVRQRYKCKLTLCGKQATP